MTPWSIFKIHFNSILNEKQNWNIYNQPNDFCYILATAIFILFNFQQISFCKAPKKRLEKINDSFFVFSVITKVPI